MSRETSETLASFIFAAVALSFGGLIWLWLRARYARDELKRALDEAERALGRHRGP